jgi:hypothetical protein
MSRLGRCKLWRVEEYCKYAGSYDVFGAIAIRIVMERPAGFPIPNEKQYLSKENHHGSLLQIEPALEHDQRIQGMGFGLP